MFEVVVQSVGPLAHSSNVNSYVCQEGGLENIYKMTVKLTFILWRRTDCDWVPLVTSNPGNHYVDKVTRTEIEIFRLVDEQSNDSGWQQGSFNYVSESVLVLLGLEPA